MNMQRLVRVAVLASLFIAPAAWAQLPAGDLSRLSAQYANWAGGKANADALIAGLRNGAAVTLVTSDPGRSVSMAGFTPAAPLTLAEVHSALAGARQSLARLGIAHPTAEQIQAALIGGDVTLSDGRSRQLAGVIAPRAAPIASR